MKYREMREGFLLLTIGIVLTLMLVLMSIAIPRLPPMRHFLLRMEIEKISMFFYFLQQRALMVHADQMLIFDEIKNTYSTKDYQEKLSSGIRFGFLPAVMGPPSKPQYSISKAISFANNTAIFYADGTISSGTIYITDDAHTALYAITVPISAISSIRAYRHNAGSWIPLS
jgi:type II secretory pathway pseudopilin PulG